MNRKVLLIVMGIVATGAAISCSMSVSGSGGGGDDDDDDVDDVDDIDGSCPIDDDSMVEIPFSFTGTDCAAVGLAIDADHVYADPTFSSFKIVGQFNIEGDGAFHLRAATADDAEVCLEPIENSGTYAVGADYPYCATKIVVDVVPSDDPDAPALCSFGVQTEVECDNDFTPADCEDFLGNDVDECFEGLTTSDVCALDDAWCWVDCHDETDGCGEWLECVESDCLNGDDDENGDGCIAVVLAYAVACPNVHYDAVYELVCVENKDPECLEHCYDTYDDCMHIAFCYESDECDNLG